MAAVVRRGATELREVVALCKRRGFVFPSNDVYGGFANSYDYGPLGTLLKRNIQESWWRRFVTAESQVLALDSAVMLPPVVWEKSGHMANFSDPLVDCKACQKRFRADHLVPDSVKAEDVQDMLEAGPCPCGKRRVWNPEVSSVRQFNLMFETSVGPVANDGAAAYLRPETAQGAFLNFGNVCAATNTRLPFGLAQTGKAFRNEVTPGNFVFRTREFEQMELEWFCANAAEGERWFEYWLASAQAWLVDTVGLRPESIRLAEHAQADLAHYARRTVDIEFAYPFGWGELWGIANRGTFDLENHGLQYRDKATNELVQPVVIEPALGLSRLVLAVLCDALCEEELPPGQSGKPDRRTVLKLAPELAPYSVAVLPLIVKNEEQVAACRSLFSRLAANPWGSPHLDVSPGTVGKRYRRHDEIGTPFCATVDYDSAADGCVTLRERDSMRQVRVSTEALSGMTVAQMSALFA